MRRFKLSVKSVFLTCLLASQTCFLMAQAQDTVVVHSQYLSEEHSEGQQWHVDVQLDLEEQAVENMLAFVVDSSLMDFQPVHFHVKDEGLYHFHWMPSKVDQDYRLYVKAGDKYESALLWKGEGPLEAPNFESQITTKVGDLTYTIMAPQLQEHKDTIMPLGGGVLPPAKVEGDVTTVSDTVENTVMTVSEEGGADLEVRLQETEVVVEDSYPTSSSELDVLVSESHEGSSTHQDNLGVQDLKEVVTEAPQDAANKAVDPMISTVTGAVSKVKENLEKTISDKANQMLPAGPSFLAEDHEGEATSIASPNASVVRPLLGFVHAMTDSGEPAPAIFEPLNAQSFFEYVAFSPESFSEGTLITSQRTGSVPQNSESREGYSNQIYFDFPKAGVYRIFMRAKLNGVEQVIPFTVDMQ